MALILDVTEFKENETIQELANLTIQNDLVVGLTPINPYGKFKELVNLKVPIKEWTGCVIVPKAKLDEEVPSNFEKSSKVKTETEEYDEPVETLDEETGEMTTVYLQKTRQVPVLDENDEPVMIQKTWREYTITYEFEAVEDDEGNSQPAKDPAILIGYRDNNKNRSKPVSSKELYDYINHFGIDAIRHKYDYLDYIKVEQGDEF